MLCINEVSFIKSSYIINKCTLNWLIIYNIIIQLYMKVLPACFSLWLYTGAELTPWSQWACFNSTVASRARIVQNCSDVEYIDPVTNMPAMNRSCDNRTETDRRTGTKLDDHL